VYVDIGAGICCMCIIQYWCMYMVYEVCVYGV
jgi:hypothetical protein